MVYVLALFVLLAVLGPLFGADSRDGLDWTRNHFWLRRKTGPSKVAKAAAAAPAPAGRAQADACRTIPAAG